MVMLGLFSYVVDSMQMQSAEASARRSAKVSCCSAHAMLSVLQGTVVCIVNSIIKMHS